MTICDTIANAHYATRTDMAFAAQRHPCLSVSICDSV